MVPLEDASADIVQRLVYETSTLGMSVRFRLSAQKIYKIMLVKTTIKEETTIYVGDKLVVMVNEVEIVKHFEDTQD